jgi:hypothetical protein
MASLVLSGVFEYFHDVGLSIPGGTLQWRPLHLVLGGWVSAFFEQQPDEFGFAILGRPMQGCDLHIILGVYVGSLRDQQPGEVDVPMIGSQIQRRLLLLVLGVDIGPCVEGGSGWRWRRPS